MTPLFLADTGPRERAFLFGLLADPLDPVVRAAYADWLEAEGRAVEAGCHRVTWSQGEGVVRTIRVPGPRCWSRVGGGCTLSGSVAWPAWWPADGFTPVRCLAGHWGSQPVLVAYGWLAPRDAVGWPQVLGDSHALDLVVPDRGAVAGGPVVAGEGADG